MTAELAESKLIIRTKEAELTELAAVFTIDISDEIIFNGSAILLSYVYAILVALTTTAPDVKIISVGSLTNENLAKSVPL